MFGFRRNRCSASGVTGVRLAPEYALSKSILDSLRNTGQPLLARELAERCSGDLGVSITRKQVNHCLYGALSGQLIADGSYRWWFREAPWRDPAPPPSVQQPTPSRDKPRIRSTPQQVADAIDLAESLEYLGPVDLTSVIDHHPQAPVVEHARTLAGELERDENAMAHQASKRMSLSRKMEDLSTCSLDVIARYHRVAATRREAAALLKRKIHRLQMEHAGMDGLGVPVHRLWFSPLAPGSWSIDDVIGHYRRVAEHLPPDFEGREIQWERLRQIASLKPDKCYVGNDMWLGYVVFSFGFSRHVVLECPVEGNATYVLRGDWTQMVQFPKRIMREVYPHRYTKVVHKGSWLSRVRAAL